MTMRAIVLALCAALATPAAAQIPDFAALPEITGATTQEIGAGERALIWLTPAETGLYRVGLSSPGVLALYTFDTADGRFDGAAEPRRLRQESSRMQPPALADLLLPAGRPYLLVAQSAREAATLSVSAEALGTAQTPGEATPDGGNWSVLYRMDEKDAEPVWAGLGEAAPPLKLEAIAEPRAKSGIEYGRREIPPGGLWPMDHGEDTGIGISASVSAGPPPLVLLRASAAPEGYDEREGSSDGTAQPMGNAETVRGVFLPVDDDDTYTFTLDADATLDLKIAAGERWTTFGAELQRVEDGKAYPVAERRSREGGIEFGPLALGAGDWRLLLERDDDERTPVDYTIFRTPAPAPKAGFEAEPNDSLFAAFPLSEAGTLRGSLAEDDRDIVAFEITEPDRLTRLFGVRGVDRMILRDRHGAGIADVQAQGGRAMLDSLVLAPGRYTLEMRGEGDYAFKRMDLGEAPSDYERQPNGTEDTAQRLALGGSLRGAFDNERDHDMIAFRLDRETDIALTITAPDDGKTTVWLRHDRAPWGETARFEPGSAPYLYEASLPAGDYVLALRSDSARSRGLWQVSLERRGANPGGEPDHLPARLRAMPLDGDLPGRIGAFDGLDLIHIPLPEGAGQLAVGCIGTDGGDNPDWKLHTYGDAEQLASESIEPVGLAYDPALGGALRLSVRGGGSESGYRCMLRGVPDALPEAHEAPEQKDPVTFTPGMALTGRFDDSRDFDALRLDLAENEIGLLHCRLGAAADQPLPDGMVRWQGEILPSDPLEGFTLLRREPGAETIVTLRGDYAESTPESWTCALWDEDTLPRPADLGPMAEFTALTLRAPEDAAPQIAPPPQLLPGRPDWLPKAAATGDAPLEISVDGLETPLAAYARSGQAVAAEVTVTNTGEAAVETALEARMLAEGWRISGAPAPLTLAPGESGTVSLSLEAPPLLSPAVAPAIAVSARVGDAVAATVADVPLALDAPTLGARPHWSAPEAMRGGLNVLDHALGARIISRDGKEADEKFAQDYSFLHDGLAPHISTRTAFYREIEFNLASEAPVAGAVLHLRSSMERASWPAGYEIALAGADGAYEVVAEGRLTGSSAPQYIVFDAPKAASRLRLRVPGCQGEPDCNGPALQEVQAIAEPGWRLAEPPAISRPDLGGHVVWASDALGGSWNNRVLTGERKELSVLRANDRNGPVMSFAVAFHQNRAALIDRIDWVGHEKDKTRAEGAEVAYSIEGPGGPWQVLGQLPAPAEGEERATLALETPVWARYLRFVVTRAPKSTLAGPDRVEVFEAASGPSVLGLWEDDSPRAGYEFTHPATTLAAPAPAGGPDEGSAVPLPLDESVASSVLLERNEDWWRLTVPEGPPQLLTLDFGIARGEYEFALSGPEGAAIPLTDEKSGIWSAILAPGDYRLRIWEPPRSVVISWDTSGSVGAYIPKTLEAVRRWARALHPGRDALQLLPFGQESLALPDWAERPEEVEPYLATLEPRGSSNSEGAMRLAATALAEREGARGIVIITDAETSIDHAMWEQALKAQPRVVSLSIDSDSRQNAAVMMDWAAINGGLFHRVVGIQGLADGLDMAASLFRKPKPYRLTAALETVQEPEGEATLVITATELEEGGSAQAAGAVEIILDASGSMLKRMEGRRRIAIAHDALSALVRETLPEGALLAFRAFGLERDACRSELTIPLAPLDRSAAERAIRSVPAINLAKTAIARSLLAVRDDLAAAAPPRVVVLVTDGEETCDGDVAAAIETLRADGFDVRVNIVGFAIDDAGLAKTFASWAEAGGGQYFDAGDPAALGDAVTRAVSPRFAIIRERYDGTEERIGVIGLDEPLTVPAGRIRAEPAGAASGGPVRVELRDGEDAALGYAAQAGLSAP